MVQPEESNFRISFIIAFYSSSLTKAVDEKHLNKFKNVKKWTTLA